MNWKRILLSILFVAGISKLYAGKDEQIRSIVYKWNELHNTKNTSEFLNLYADNVLFYSMNYSREKCFEVKDKFLRSDFTQEIITDIDLTYFNSGIIKADFTKRTHSKKGTREHVCYLLLKKNNGKYLITGESDLLTDQRRNVQLNLGDSIQSPRKRTTTYLIGLFIIAASFFGWKWFKRRQNEQFENGMQYQQTSTPAVAVPPPVLKVNQEELKDDIVSQVKDVVREEISKMKPSEEKDSKGDAFEKYIIERFDVNYFKLKEWRSDKIHKGIYPESNMNPDLVYQFQSNSASAVFAVECKWRAEFQNGHVDWAKSYQLDNYRKFEKEHRMRVFLIMGIGGKPDAPASLYIIPLDEIRGTRLYENQIKKYYRYSKSNFFLNADYMMLS